MNFMISFVGDQENDSDDNIPSPSNENNNMDVAPPAEFDHQLPARHAVSEIITTLYYVQQPYHNYIKYLFF